MAPSSESCRTDYLGVSVERRQETNWELGESNRKDDSWTEELRRNRGIGMGNLTEE